MTKNIILWGNADCQSYTHSVNSQFEIVTLSVWRQFGKVQAAIVLTVRVKSSSVAHPKCRSEISQETSGCNGCSSRLLKQTKYAAMTLKNEVPRSVPLCKFLTPTHFSTVIFQQQQHISQDFDGRLSLRRDFSSEIAGELT